MKITAILTPAWQAINYGRELRNAEGWKNAQIWTSLILALLAAAGAVGIPIPAMPTDFTTALGVVLAGAANAYLTAGTSSRVGITPTTPPPGSAAAVITAARLSTVAKPTGPTQPIDYVPVPGRRDPALTRTDGPDLP